MTISILVYILSFLVFVQFIWIFITEYRLKKIFAGTKAKNLENVIIELGKNVNNLNKSQTEINEHLLVVDKRLSKSIRSVEVLRFNPFLEAGNNQSFAISFINDEGNGVIMSSLYARDRMSIFAKPIKSGKSDFELTIEEKEVLDKSK